MTRADGSGAYLGGIGTMLAQSDVCPACGGVHEQPLIRFGSRAEADCPVVFGSIPSFAGAEEFALEEPSVAATEAVYPGSVPAPSSFVRRSTLSVPWPMPSLSEEFF